MIRPVAAWSDGQKTGAFQVPQFAWSSSTPVVSSYTSGLVSHTLAA